MGADETAIQTEEAPASFSEAWRILWQVKTLRRIFIALPIISIPLVALVAFVIGRTMALLTGYQLQPFGPERLVPPLVAIGLLWFGVYNVALND